MTAILQSDQPFSQEQSAETPPILHQQRQECPHPHRHLPDPGHRRRGRRLLIDDIMAHGPKDSNTGILLTREQVKEHYLKTEYESGILLPDRVQAMCEDLFAYLLEAGGPEQKTIIFCTRDRHADDVAVCLNSLYAQWCAAQGRERLEPYAFKCTAASSGNDQLPDLRGSSRSHFIATTVDLLTTGVDVPCVRKSCSSNTSNRLSVSTRWSDGVRVSTCRQAS